MFVPQHGGGRLYQGGVPGHKGGPGRPPTEVRKISRQAYESRVPRLLEIIDDPESKASEVVAAMALLERNGFGQRLEVEPVATLDPIELRERILERARQVKALPPADDVDD